ncbi:MAG: thioredoxin [Alteromonas sp.]|nr:thioredoxin [Alteromonas sp.]MAY22248.1 thioredoxin [Flavobacteriaceae bacterium]|tara:strand:+ start:14872 stop:15888 length:1017 start_codon:yes stop_codon:yes gene_type:complete
MKKILLPLLALALFACNEPKEKEKDYVSFSGKISNNVNDSIQIFNGDYKKIILVAEDGSFEDTLHIVNPGMYNFKGGDEYTSLFLRNGYEINMTLDADKFDESIKYEGEGSENNNFLAQRYLMEEKLFDINVDDMDSTALQNKLAEIEVEMNKFIDSKENIDSVVVNSTRKNVKASVKNYGRYLNQMVALRQNLPEGTPSPTFKDYENHAGGTTSLSDLKGKYVYVDVWATWCGPCKAEIPYLKEVEEEFKEENIAFVSISIDREKDHEKWENMVAEETLGGIQLFADKDWESQFVKDYYISGIPRFILIDPEGKIVSPDAPRPSNPKLKEMLKEKLM